MRTSAVMACVAGVCVCAATHLVVATARPNEPRGLPRGLSGQLSKQRPDARVVTLEDLSKRHRYLFRKDHGGGCPGLVRANFYGNGKPTWALSLIEGENRNQKAELVVARQTGQSWEILSLEKADGTPVVWREGPGKYVDVCGAKTIRAMNPVNVFVGYESWGIVYAWTGKAVEKVQISD